jgi:hypothetical protein
MKKTFTLSQSLLKIAFIPLMLILLGNEAHSQTTYYDNYAIRIPLTLNNASLGITTDQTNFAVLLKVVSPSFVTGACSNQTGGTTSVPPFAIIDSAYSTTTELYYQVENWDFIAILVQQARLRLHIMLPGKNLPGVMSQQLQVLTIRAFTILMKTPRAQHLNFLMLP